MVVDDEPDITLALRLGLESQGFQVDAFNDAIEALSNFRSSLYDLLLLDIKMPSMNGFELYNEMKKIDDKVKICFLSAFEIYYDEFRRLLPRVNVRCFARKPIEKAVSDRSRHKAVHALRTIAISCSGITCFLCQSTSLA